MKRYILVFPAVILIVLAGCKGRPGKGSPESGSAKDTGKAVISFVQNQHDFGKVKEGEKIGCIFTFMNTGTSDLVILSALTSCGCTVPKYDKSPISPGKSGTIEVIFDTSGRFGTQTKTITVKSNAATPVVLLQIRAEVSTSNNN